MSSLLGLGVWTTVIGFPTENGEGGQLAPMITAVTWEKNVSLVLCQSYQQCLWVSCRESDQSYIGKLHGRETEASLLPWCSAAGSVSEEPQCGITWQLQTQHVRHSVCVCVHVRVYLTWSLLRGEPLGFSIWSNSSFSPKENTGTRRALNKPVHTHSKWANGSPTPLTIPSEASPTRVWGPFWWSPSCLEPEETNRQCDVTPLHRMH